jgi:hypothetical protein
MVSVLLPLLLTAGAAGPVDVVVARRIDVPPARAVRLVNGLARELERAGLKDVRGPGQAPAPLEQASTERCRNDKRCLAEAARSAGSRLLVGLDVGLVMDQVAFSIFALTPADEVKLVKEAFTVPVTEEDLAIVERFAAFAERVVKAAPAAAPRDAPVKPQLAGPNAESVAAVAEEERAVGRSLVLPAVVTTAAVGAAALGTWLAVNAAAAAQSVEAAQYESLAGPASRMTRPEAEAAVRRANEGAALAAASGAATGLLAYWAIWLWSHGEPAPSR